MVIVFLYGTALVFKSFIDDVALSEALREALEASVEQLTSMGAMGRSRIIEDHDTLKEAAKLKLLFEETLSATSYGA